MAIVKRIILFLFLNFAALAIGGFFTKQGVSSHWYNNFEKAPWTPPGWGFGIAWSVIMICFSIYMAYLLKIQSRRTQIILFFSIQWILNVSWNPIFFYFHAVSIGMITISLLTICIAFLFFYFKKELGFKSLLLLPYLVWLIIAASLNGYILYYN